MLEQQEYIGLLIGAARRRLKQAVVAHLVPHRLSTQQFWILLAIRDLPGASLGAVAERQRLDLPTASRVVTSLCERGLVLLERSLDDRRRASVKLTAKGETLARKLLRKVLVNLDAHVAVAHAPAPVKRKVVRA